MPKASAGVLMWKRDDRGLHVLLVHPGGPFWARKDLGAWSIPKGEYDSGEDALAAARREFAEELGIPVDGPLTPLGEVRQKAGKVVTCFAAEGDVDAGAVRANRVEIEWPPRSGKRQSFPEIDRAGWFSLAEARVKINPAQAVFLDRLVAAVG